VDRRASWLEHSTRLSQLASLGMESGADQPEGDFGISLEWPGAEERRAAVDAPAGDDIGDVNRKR